MKQLLIAGAVLVLCIVAVLLYAATLSPSPKPLAVEPGAPTESAPRQSGAAAGEEGLDVARPSSPSSPAEAPSSAADASQVAPADPQRAEAVPLDWVEGLVRVPEGTPADESIEVLAFRTDGGAADRARIATESELAADTTLVARAPAGRDGAFRIQVPSHRGSLQLALRARYLRSDSSVEIDPAAAPPGRIELAAELGSWVTGRIAFPADATAEERDLSDVQIELGLDPLRSLAVLSRQSLRGEQPRTHCTPEMEFEFRGVPAGLECLARAAPNRLAAGKSVTFHTEAGRHEVADLALSRGGRIAGTVRDTSGAPVAGAEIEAWIDPVAFRQGGLRVRDAKSDPSGLFALENVAVGEVILRIEKAGYINATREVQLADGQSLTGVDIALGLGNSIAGRVTWPDGTPVAKIEVDVEFDVANMAGMGALNALTGAEGEDETDESGRFEVSGLGKGPFTVRAEAAGRDAPEQDVADVARNARWRARASGVKPGTADLELVLEPPLTISGRVVDLAGEPIPKFRVRARTVGTGQFPGLGADIVADEFSDESGVFALVGLRSGKWELRAEAETFAPSEETPLELPAAAGTPVTIQLARCSSAAGIVLDSTGAPAPGAQVGLKLELSQILSQVGERTEPVKVVADEEGRFVLGGLEPRPCALVATSEDSAPSEPLAIEPAAGEQVEGLVLRLRLGGTLTGDVFDKEGKPAAGATVIAQNPSDYTTQRFATCDGEGRFRIEHLAPATWQVIQMSFEGMREMEGDDTADFMSAFSDMRMASAEIEDGKETHVVLGAPPKDPVQIHGRVVLGGKGVPGVFVSFIADGKGGMESIRFVTTGADGTYSLQLDEPGGQLVTVQKITGTGQQQSFASFLRVPEVDDFEHDIRLPVGGISGSVRDADGSPAESVRVTLNVEGALPNASLIGEQYAEITTDGSGAYELVWLKPGKYTVSVGGAALGGMFGSDGSTRARQVKSGLQVDADEWLRGVDFRLEAPGEIAGVVVDSRGQPVSGATIFARDASGAPLERLSMVQTDASGRFRYGGLGEGEYTLTARTSSEVTSQPVGVRVRAGETSDARLSLGAGTMLVVSLSDADGNPVEARFSVLDEAGHQVNGMMSMTDVMEAMQKGSFSSREQRVGPLPPGKYRVTASTDSGASVNKPVTLSGQAERKLNLRL